MSVAISGRVVVATSAGNFTAPPSRYVYLRPSRTDFQFSLDAGVTWENWQGDPDLAGSYPGAIRALCNGAGDWTFTVPWTDDPAETRLPGGALVPDLLWNIIDPNPSTGRIVYYGATKAAIVAAAKNIKELTTLASPDTWQVGSVTYTAVPVGPRRFVTVPFTSAGREAAIVMDSIGSAAWKFGHGIESDDASTDEDDKFYLVKVDTNSKTDTGATLRISDLPPVGKTVLAHIEVYL